MGVTKPQQHGTLGGHRQHQQRKEPPCTSCRLAYNEYMRELRQKSSAAKKSSTPATGKDHVMSADITIEEHERGIDLLEESLERLDNAEAIAGARDIANVSRTKAEIYEQIEARRVAIRRIENPEEEQEAPVQTGFQLHIVPNTA